MRVISSSNPTFGFPTEDFFAREMSGWRTFGSSTGNGPYSMPDFFGDADDLLRGLFDRYLARIADVDRPVEGRCRCGDCRSEQAKLRHDSAPTLFSRQKGTWLEQSRA
ncbi:MAG: hypothetical protein ACR2II_11330 [Chthoniobacterales bacterium]